MDHDHRSSQDGAAGPRAGRDDAPPERHGPARAGVSRRSFMQTLGVSAAAGAVQSHPAAAESAPWVEDQPDNEVGPGPTRVTLTINARDRTMSLEPATTLMEALRWEMRMTGTKEVCDRGSCGACSVLIDGRLVASCMMLAIDAEGREVTTIEGIADGDRLDPIQEAFVAHDALQCGYCTPGLVMAAKALLDENPRPSLDEIKGGLSGNICRCGTYTNVFNAVLAASGQTPIHDPRATNGRIGGAP